MLPLRAARERAPLILCPANLAPVAGPPTAVVLHDAAPLREPGWYSRAYVAWQRAMLPLVARHARVVLTVSAFSRDELVDLLGLDPARVAVVPGGVDGRFTPAADPAPARAALGLERPYVLTVASRTARKNLGVLETAARRLAAPGRRPRRGRGRPPAVPRRGGPVGGARASATCPTSTCPASTRARRPSCCPRATRASG